MRLLLRRLLALGPLLGIGTTVRLLKVLRFVVVVLLILLAVGLPKLQLQVVQRLLICMDGLQLALLSAELSQRQGVRPGEEQGCHFPVSPIQSNLMESLHRLTGQSASADQIVPFQELEDFRKHVEGTLKAPELPEGPDVADRVLGVRPMLTVVHNRQRLLDPAAASLVDLARVPAEPFAKPMDPPETAGA